MGDALTAAGMTPQESATQPVEEERLGGTTLLTSVASEAAEREWTRSLRAGDAELYIDGFTECASRLPSERDIEIAILGRTATQAAKAVCELIERGIRG